MSMSEAAVVGADMTELHAHPDRTSLADALLTRGITRRTLLKLCAGLAAGLALPATEAATIARALVHEPRPRVVWLALQGCTGCTESATRAHEPTLESLILESLSLDYHTTLMAAAGDAAQSALAEGLHTPGYVLAVEGAVPRPRGVCTTGGEDDAALLRRAAPGAAMILAVGSCAAFGGLPAATPNPTAARGVADELAAAGLPVNRLVNLPGCPPLPQVVVGTLVHWLTYHRLPTLDGARRPVAYYGETVHDRCSRRPHYEARRFARSFDDAGARRGWCLLKLGCRGPSTANACTRLGWNGAAAYPMRAGHSCIGCAEAGFWDDGGLYEPQLPARRLRGAGSRERRQQEQSNGGAAGRRDSDLRRKHQRARRRRYSE
jgi:hydrogenase small subunit